MQWNNFFLFHWLLIPVCLPYRNARGHQLHSQVAQRASATHFEVCNLAGDAASGQLLVSWPCTWVPQAALKETSAPTWALESPLFNYFYLAMPNLRNLTSSTRDQIHASLQQKRRVLTTGPPGQAWFIKPCSCILMLEGTYVGWS